jgi:hypothetical protein
MDRPFESPKQWAQSQGSSGVFGVPGSAPIVAATGAQTSASNNLRLLGFLSSSLRPMTRAELRYVSTRKLAPRRPPLPGTFYLCRLVSTPIVPLPTFSPLVACLVFFLSEHFDVVGPGRSSLVDKRAAPPSCMSCFSALPFIHTYIYIFPRCPTDLEAKRSFSRYSIRSLIPTLRL